VDRESVKDGRKAAPSSRPAARQIRSASSWSLLNGKKAMVIYARGLDYTSDSSFTPEHGYDFQKPYLETWLRFIGITDVASITVQKTLAGPVIDGDARAEARRKARALAKDF
jgi:FMN-dependent NADH-azoreductase